MPDIQCKEPGCPHLITDPCVKLEGLFSLRKELSERIKNVNEEGQEDLLHSVDRLLEKELGLNQKASKALFDLKKAKDSGPILFTLKCILGHIHQYSITCQS